MIAILLAAAISLPDPKLTPGVVRPFTTAQVCGTKWGKDVRHVTEKMKIDVAARYHIEWPPRRKGHRLTAHELALRARWIVDHWMPRELAGADVLDNLWLQPADEAHVKDIEESRLHRAVCAGRMSLRAAQRQMRSWGQ